MPLIDELRDTTSSWLSDAMADGKITPDEAASLVRATLSSLLGELDAAWLANLFAPRADKQEARAGRLEARASKLLAKASALRALAASDTESSR